LAPGSLNRRAALGLGGAAALAGLAPRTGRAQELAEITFAFGPDDTGTLQPLINLFNQLNEGRIRVIHQEMARESNDFYLQIKSDFEVGAADFDVIGADVIWTAEFAENGWVRDISSWFHNAYDPKAFVDAALRSAVWQFSIYGVPWYTDAGLLFYRKDLLDEAGISAPPVTFGQLQEQARTVMDQAGVPHGYVFQGAEYEGGVTNALEFIWNAGGRVMTGSVRFPTQLAQPSGEPNVIEVDNPEAAAGLDVARRLIADGIAPEAVTTYREQETWEAFGAGDAVFMRNWPFAFGALTGEGGPLAPEQIGVAPLPVIGEGRRSYSCLGGWNLMINNASPQAEAAWEFIRFATAGEQQAARAMGGFLPTLKTLYEDPAITDAVPVVALGGEAVQHARNRPESPLYGSMSPRIARAFNRVLRGQVSGAEAVANLQRELRTLLRRYG
jgi:multiple sugar transport system substrate-binding protein